MRVHSQNATPACPPESALVPVFQDHEWKPQPALWPCWPASPGQETALLASHEELGPAPLADPDPGLFPDTWLFPPLQDISCDANSACDDADSFWRRIAP